MTETLFVINPVSGGEDKNDLYRSKYSCLSVSNS